MPKLKHLTCTVEWSGSATPLQEFQTTYGDGYVQTYVAVPPIPTPFSIHLRSHGYIAPGLAMYVYIDGEYQCNRFRQNLRMPDGTTTQRQTEVDFRVRQKEEMLEDGTFEGKQWRFENLNIVTAPDEHAGRLAAYNGEHVGTIEVVVLRCYPGEVPSSTEGSSPEPAKQPKQSAKPKQPKEQEKTTPPSSSDDSSSSSSDSGSSVSIPAAMTGVFDGADDHFLEVPGNMIFGGDMARDDDPPLRHGGSIQWGANASGSNKNKGRYIPPSQRGSTVKRKDDDSWGGSNISRDHFNEDWGKYSSRISRNNSPEPQAAARRNSTEKSPSFGKRMTSATDVANQGKTQSPQVNVPVAAGQSSPAIIINVNHGGVSPASIAPSVLAPAAPTVNSWALSDEQNEKEGDKNSSESNDSSSSKNGSVGFKGHRKKESWAMNMPGGWGASNVESRANSNGWNENGDNEAQPNKGWTNTKDQPENNNDGWNNNGESGAQKKDQWGATASGAQENNVGWKNNGSNGNQDNSGWGNNGKGAKLSDDWNCGNAGNEQAVSQSWGGPTEQKNGWDMPKKSKIESQAKAASDKSNGFPKYTMEFTQSPNMGTAGQVNPPDLTTWPGNEAAANNTPEQAQISAVSGTAFQPKPYWSTWNRIPNIPEEGKAPEPKPEPPVAFDELLPGVPIEVAQRNNMSHQVHTDKPAPYVHKTSAARHMDSLDSPYAVFIFKYRSSAILEKMLNTKLVEPEAEEKRRLSTLSKEELIEHFMRAKANAGTYSTSSTISTAVPPSFQRNDNNNVPTGGSDFSNALDQKLNQLNVNNNGSDKVSSNPSNHWGRGHSGNGNGHGNENGHHNRWNALPSSPVHNPVTGWFNTGGGDPVTSPTRSWDNHNQDGGGTAPVGSPTGWDNGQATAGANGGWSQKGGSQKAGSWNDWSGNGGGSAAAGSW